MAYAPGNRAASENRQLSVRRGTHFAMSTSYIIYSLTEDVFMTVHTPFLWLCERFYSNLNGSSVKLTDSSCRAVTKTCNWLADPLIVEKKNSFQSIL